jgi:DNA polymerase III epsilon subunit-like protein
MEILMDVMLDFETMGNGPTSAVVQIGMVKFVIGTGEVAGEFLCNVDLTDELARGFDVTGSTIEWWMGQAAKGADTWSNKDGLDSLRAFNRANDFMKGAKRVWSHASFDAPIMTYHLAVLGIQSSVRYNRFVDLRTLTLMAKGLLSIPKQKRPAGAHDALVDALYQCEYATMCYKAVKKLP